MVNLPKGFKGSGVSAGIKSTGARDLALIVNEGPQKFGTAVFTSNKIVAAPVIWSKQVVKDHEVSAVILNSGGANACTGPEGFADTHRTAEYVAQKLGISAGDVLVCSTGLIGERLPMPAVLSGIDLAVDALSAQNAELIAQGIMTTDTNPKYFTKEFKGVTIFGMAKGAGMLAPSLATMLSVIAIDALVDESAVDLLKEVASETFERIDSDGCMSTNDTVSLMASGASGIVLSREDLKSLLFECASYLAHELIADAEGHTKIVEILTINAASLEDALEVGRSCARNNLLKCALNGADANWGRVLAAVGTTSAKFNPLTIDVSLNGVMVCRDSAPGANRLEVDLTGKEITIVIDLKAGNFSGTIWTNDLSAMYVHENSAYSS
jgi:glutamate N-acetyltransferase / amino-acid N-acetyltransferase